MNKQILLPRKYRTAGCVLLPFAVALMVAYYKYDFSIGFLKYNMHKGGSPDYFFSPNTERAFSGSFSADYTGTVGMVLSFLALFMIAFSKEKKEDEYVSYVRLKALQISVYANYLILALTALALFGGSFLMVMEVNMFTILILFIMVYQYQLHLKPRFSKTHTV